ncbi:MAG TPA: tetratricopeptide repeat protein [Chthoniobacterales bacterium]
MLFRSKHVELIYQEGESDCIIVTFNGIGSRADGKRFWGDTFLKKNGLSAMGFVSTHRNWFPRESMDELIEIALPILKNYKQVCTYGASMGAYGAIKFSRRLGAHTVVAFSPQYTIDPSQKHTAFTYFYNAELNQGVTIEAEDIGGNVFLFFDPTHLVDNYAANYIAKLCNANLVPVPYIGHTTIVPFAKSGRGLEVLKLSMAGEPKPLRQLSQHTRRNHGGDLRVFHLALRLIEKHISLALAVCEKYPQILDEQRLVAFSRELQRFHQIGPAIAWAQASVDRDPARANAFRNLSGFLRASGNLAEAKQALHKALQIEPANHQFMMKLSIICCDLQQIDEGIDWARKAIEAAPHDPQSFYNLVLIQKNNQPTDQAIETLQQALIRHPRNNSFKVLLEELQNAQS